MKFHTKIKDLYQPNVEDTKVLAEDAKKNGLSHFIATSSTEAMGSCRYASSR